MARRCFAFLAAALVCVLIACGGDTEDEGLTPPTMTPESPGAASPIPQPSGSPASLTRTEVVRFEPPISAPVRATGTCFGRSLAVERPDGWRCQASNQIHDPCFGSYDAMRVVCVSTPFEDARIVEINLLNPACTDALGGNLLCRPEALPAANPAVPRAWAFETAAGVRCVMDAGGTAPVLNGLRLNYPCRDDSGVIGEPAAGTIWTARRVARPPTPVDQWQTPVPETSVELRKVWW